MKIDYHLYELEAHHSLNTKASTLKREGALLKVTFESGAIGYADCHPWPELGDLPLMQQLNNLAQGASSPLMSCALKFASLDAKYRSQGRNIFVHSRIPHSHYLITDILKCAPEQIQQIIQQNYTHVKLKLGRCIEQESERLLSLFWNTPLKLRFDFNERLTPETFCHFLKRIQKLQEQVDFIEDPFPFHSEQWESVQKEGWTLACDRQAHSAIHQNEAARVLIIKPAIQSFLEWKTLDSQHCIVTSYLGHPLGQLAAAYVASQIDPSCSRVHGLLSHHVYQTSLFSQYLNWQGPTFTFPNGPGFGFQNELDSLEWISL